MNYLLTVLTNGRPHYLRRTLASLAEHLTPKPSALFVVDDGSTTPLGEIEALVAPLIGHEVLDDRGRFLIHRESPRIGQCAAMAVCWRTAASSRVDWTFHIEDDYVLLRPLDLRKLATVIEREDEAALRAHDHSLVQMALVRTPWGAEVEHGGYIAKDPGWYERKSTTQGWEAWHEWIEQTRNWTNAPCLFPTHVARTFPWPAEPGCETTIGPRILSAWPGARFGLWGWGEAWAAHIGVERAPGSHGY